MRILRLEIKNFKPYEDLVLPEEGELPTGLILVSGPNSTGKSSLFEAILWALWGAESLDLKNDDLVNFSSTFCRVVVVFEVGGVVYKIDRSYDAAQGPAVVLYEKRGSDVGWKRIAEKSHTVKRSVEEILGIEWTQARNTLLVKQGEVASIASATPSDLRDLLVKVYNIEVLETMTNHLDSLESDLSARLDEISAKYRPPESVQAQIDDARRRITGHEKDRSRAQEQLENYQKEMARLPSVELLSRVRELAEAERRGKRDLERLNEQFERLLKRAGIVDSSEKVIRARREYLVQEEQRLKTKIEEVDEERGTVDQEIGSLAGLAGDLTKKIDLLRSVDTTQPDAVVRCPTCSKPLTPDELESILSDYTQRLEDYNERHDSLTLKKRELSDTYSKCSDQLSMVTKALEATLVVHEHYEQVRAANESYRETVQQLSEELAKIGFASLDDMLRSYKKRDIGEIVEYISGLNDKLELLRNSIESAQEKIDQEKSVISRLEAELAQMRKLKAQMDELKRLDSHCKYLRLKLVRGFIADHIFQKRLIGIVRSATNQYLQAFTNGQYTRVDFEPTPAKGKSGSGLLLTVYDQRDNAVKRPVQLSNGDRTAVSLALRLGISRTMSSVRPLKGGPAVSPRIRCVLLDEPLGGLDKTRRELVLRGLVDESGFEQVFLITHTDVELENIASKIIVSRSGPTSTATLDVFPDQ
ncbi:MAG: AAA family ATPase [Candidatus Thorarchaeota archaeon]